MGGSQVIERKSLTATIHAVSPATAEKPYGGFTAVASDETLDRDGEVLYQDEWVTPLPERVTIDVDHGMSVGTTVGSAVPYFQDGALWVDAAFSSIERAQEVRTLVAEGHVSTVSVAAQVDRSGAKPRRTLLNVGIVSVPANPNAVITSAKGVAFKSALAAVLAGQDVDAATIKSLGGDGAMVQAIHDAAGHLGAKCVKSYDPDELDDDGEGADDDDFDESGESDGANKAFQLRALQLRMKALQR
jgi:hypothetical protein